MSKRKGLIKCQDRSMGIQVLYLTWDRSIRGRICLIQLVGVESLLRSLDLSITNLTEIGISARHRRAPKYL